MDIKKLTMGIVAVAVATVFVAGCAIPILSDVSDQTGDPITKTNVGMGHTFREMVPGDVLKCASVYSDIEGNREDFWTLNNKTVLNDTTVIPSWDWFLVTDVVFGNISSRFNASAGSITNITANPGTPIYMSGATETINTKIYIFEMDSDKKIQYTYIEGDTEKTSIEYTPTWAYVIASVEDSAYMSTQDTTDPYFAKYGAKDIILAGTYTTGDFDTGYYYGKDGDLTILNDSYTGAVNFSQELSDGTTDIYDTTVTVTITDGSESEVFSPYRALVPYEVQGHADKGTVYSIVNIIPVMMVLGIVIGAIALFIKK